MNETTMKPIDTDKALDLLHNAGIAFSYGYDGTVNLDKPSYVIRQEDLSRLFNYIAKTVKSEEPDPSK